MTVTSSWLREPIRTRHVIPTRLTRNACGVLSATDDRAAMPKPPVAASCLVDICFVDRPRPSGGAGAGGGASVVHGTGWASDWGAVMTYHVS